MKTRLLFALTLITFSLNAQTTHNLDWFAGIGSNVDLTITSGDTVIWTWTSSNHTVENIPGSSVETFDSGFLGDTGSTFEYMFTVVGLNDYFCGVHGVSSMSGTITVEDNLGIEGQILNSFNIYPNPAESKLNISLKTSLENLQISIHDLLGKKVMNKSVGSEQAISIDISSLNNGFYLITLESDDNILTKRFIKE